MSGLSGLSATPPTSDLLSKSELPPTTMPKENPDYPERMGQPWTEDEIAKLHSEIAAKISFEEIAKEHKRTVNAVVAYLKNMAYHTHKEGKTVEEIASLTGLTDSQIKNAIEKRKSLRSTVDTPTRSPAASPRTFATVAKAAPTSEIADLKAQVAELRRDLEELKRAFKNTKSE